MNNFFNTPTASETPTLTNPLTGETFTVTQVFRDLFNPKNFCHALWRKGDDHSKNVDLRDCMDFTVLRKDDKWVGNGTAFGEASEESVRNYYNERGDMAAFLMYDEESPFFMLSKNIRKLLVKNEAGDKVLNVELISKLLSFELDNGMKEYALGYRLEGEAGDWYFRRPSDENSCSCCFGDTQSDSAIYLLYRTLNVYSAAVAAATKHFREGVDGLVVSDLLIGQFGNVSDVIAYAFGNANRKAENVAVWVQGSTYVKSYISDAQRQKTVDVNQEDVRIFDTMEQASIWAEVANRVLSATNHIRVNALNIEDLTTQIEERKEQAKLCAEQLAAAQDCMRSVESQLLAL